MKAIKKIIFSVLIMVMILPVALLLTACGGGENGKLIDLTMSTSQFHTTKNTYHVGDEFSPGVTYVQLTFYKKADKQNYQISYPLTKLDKEIDDIEYEVIGFDSSAAVESQEITIKISSPTYKNEVTVKFNIKILPEYIVNSEIVDETVIKSQYVLNEVFDCSKVKIKNTYNNGREEVVDVTNEMVSGFDTSTITVKNKQMVITYNEKEFKFNYVVAPSDKYELLNTQFVDCYVPAMSLGYSKTEGSLKYTYSKDKYATIQIGCYNKFPHTESYIKILYDTTGNWGSPNVVIISHEEQNINGIDATVCKFNHTGSSIVYTGIFFDRNVTLGNTTSECTVEVLFINYAGSTNDETTEVYNTLISTMAK